MSFGHDIRMVVAAAVVFDFSHRGPMSCLKPILDVVLRKGDGKLSDVMNTLFCTTLYLNTCLD
jgi:hypothetical protein